jgi:hypothetical protein
MTIKRVIRNYPEEAWDEFGNKPVKPKTVKQEKEHVETIEKDGSVVNLNHLKTAVSQILYHSKNPSGYCAEGKSVNTSGDVSDVYGGQCHSYIARIRDPSVHYSLWTGRKAIKSGYLKEEVVDTYFRWVTGEDSPWIEGRPKSLVVEVSGKKYDLGSQEFMYDNGFVFWNIDKLPSNVQHQFLIAVRQPAECPYRVNSWYYLVQQGLDPTFAYMWQSVFQDGSIGYVATGQAGYKKNHDISFAMMNFGEFNLDTSTSDEKGICNFLSHRMDKKLYNKPFKDCQNYTPVNKLWGSNTFSPHKGAYPSLLQKMYGKEIGTLKSSNSFSGAASNYFWSGKLPDAVEMGHREQKRLFEKLGISPRKIA